VTHKQGFRVELSLTDEQTVAASRHAGLSRVVENFALETVKKAWHQRNAEKTYDIPEERLTKIPWSAPALETAWRQAHPQRFPWFAEGKLSSRIPKEACRVRAAGFKNYFDAKSGKRKGQRMGFPSWRKRKHGSRFRYDADRAKPLDVHLVRLPGIGDVSTREDMSWLTNRMAAGTARILGATIREQAARWWISFQVEIDRDDINKRRTPEDAPMVGIDLGVKTFAVIVGSNGQRREIHAPAPLKAAQRALRRANKALARCQNDSHNRAKAHRKVAELHMRVSDRRRDFLHKTTTELTRTKSALAVETLNVKGMIMNRRLSRAIADAGFGEFIRQLDYKAGWYGSRVWKADRWFPSSKTCGNPSCGHVNRGLVLADRVWTCPACGAIHDRDGNAAGNLLAAMLSDAA
jgi:putative transposase